MPDYQKGQIYTIRYRLDDSLLYVGSTTQPLHKRWSEYKRHYDKLNRGCYTMLVCQKMRETNDIKNWYIELYENFSCNNKSELSKREGEIQRELKPNLNIRIENRTQKEYREDNKEKLAKLNKEYYENNKEKIKEYLKNNKEKITEKTKEYYENNKEKLADQKKKYRENNKEKIKKYRENNKEKVTCECGCIVTKNDLSRHKKTIKHKNLMENKASV